MLTEIKTTPAPDPLPSTWARLIANSITTTFREERGWQRHKLSRAIHPTGNPHPTNKATTGTIPRTGLLSNTEVLENTLYLRGAVDPNPALATPPLAWLITQFAAAGAISDEPNLTKALNTLMRMNRQALPFHARRNRHGNATLRPNPETTFEERQAITLVAAAAQIVVLDELDYWDALHEDFNAGLTIELLTQAVGN